MLTSVTMGTISPVDVPTFVWMFFVLKLPILAALLLIWYAIKEPEPSIDDEDGGSRVPTEPGPRPDRPRHPRRGPHDVRPSFPPERIRSGRGRSDRRPARH